MVKGSAEVTSRENVLFIPRQSLAQKCERNQRNCRTALHGVAPLHIPASGAQGFPFSTPSPTLISCLFVSSHPNRCEIMSCGLICIFLMGSDVEHLTMYLLVMCTSCLGKHLFHLFACFFNQIMMICVCVCVCLFWGCMYFLYTFWILTPYQIDGLQILSPTPKFQLCKMNMF